MFSYIRRLGSFFVGFKIWNFNIFGVFQKNEYFWGMKTLWICFWGHHKIGLYLGVISMHFRSRHRMGDNFLGCKKFQIFFWGA